MWLSVATDSLRLLQHVDTILVPSDRASLESRTYKEVSWKEKQFQVCECFDSVIHEKNLALVIILIVISPLSAGNQDGPGMITRMIQVNYICLYVSFMCYVNPSDLMLLCLTSRWRSWRKQCWKGTYWIHHEPS